ncbi:ribosomal-processing cysteine protease Prp [Brevibacillus humidisoli]|uniref:ribosomal-processing cysteine protease Prp n=1 Tax=Brevibacillus humidisoli TaxID=2895522 RepID=UPI001E622D19|nr:ribosomal-processing cysteine protease Prp [Brevibacillus humidisoli]UFJ39044.1 ribosomal-processing cysteine protease Prp [Brevibacillus humidisoli]
MIVITVRRDRQAIAEITISGHANAGEYGKDIVCSAVSAISFGMLNAVHLTMGIVPDVEQAAQEGGFLRWRVHPLDDQAGQEKLQLLAESMVISLSAVAEQYGQYVTVEDTTQKGGAS